MSALPAIDSAYLLDYLARLLNTPSPTGMTAQAVALTEQTLAAFPEVQLRRTPKGALLAGLTGGRSDCLRALSAHIDTLGAMVKDIRPNGRLKLTQLGGYAWNTVEGEGCTVFTAGGETRRGSILLCKSSSHVYGAQVGETKRSEDSLEVRLDERTGSTAETLALGIQVGDFVAFDPRVEIVNGFVRSRHLDDKAGVACLVAALKALHDAGLRPAQSACLLFSNYEEVGHGGAGLGFPQAIDELLVVDMAAIGEGQNSDEFHATLCVKDSSGPYHYDLTRRLRRLADQHEIAYRLDVYPYYGSDGSAYWRAGGQAPVALIGPGVDASHNYERTHLDALLATTQWILAYLLAE